MKSGLYLIIFILGSILYSCEKDDNSTRTAAPPAQQSRYNILTSHYWSGTYIDGMSIYDVNLDSIPDTLHYHYTPDSCEADDRYYFKTNGYLLRDPNIITCAEILDSIAWSLTNNDNEINIGNDNYHILDLMSSHIRLERTISTLNFFGVDTISFVYP